ncbi:hypothetical protein HBI26_235210 [Parastagonospora nodorum]|nr:hypothetical protein HBI26_235210 [Parastagonospora nodorum]KAH5997789.1 hypothetical protein HBI83_229320 [Parastagonospora nodorum]
MGSMQQQKEIATLNSLADQIKELAAKLTKQVEEENIPPITLEADSPTRYERIPRDMFMTRQLLEDALKDMWILSQGPSDSVFNYVHTTVPDVSCLNLLNQFDFWNAVPLDGEASFEEVAKRVQLPVDVVSRVFDHATTMRFFTKPSPFATSVRHTSRSAALAKEPGLASLVSIVIEETAAPMLLLPEALRQFSQGKTELTKNMKETAFKLCRSGGIWGEWENSWDFIENDGAPEGQAGYEKRTKGWRQRNFIKFMAYIKDLFNTEDLVYNALDWAGAGDITVVDIAGSAGHDSAALARKFPNLKIVVEDLPEVATVFEKEFPHDLRDRVSFKTHNMFDPQPVSADIYMLKWVLHDWPDVESVAVLRALIPALKPGARILFIDYVGKRSPSEIVLPRSIEAHGTATDLRMMTMFNAAERPAEAFKEIFEKADERFEVKRVDADLYMCVIEAVWRG